MILGAAVMDDVLGLVLLAIVSGIAVTGFFAYDEMFRIILLAGLFIAAVLKFGKYIIRALVLLMRVVKLLVFLQEWEFMLAHEGFFGLKVPFGVTPEECDGLFDSMFAFAVENLIIQSMRCFKEPLVLPVDVRNSSKDVGGARREVPEFARVEGLAPDQGR